MIKVLELQLQHQSFPYSRLISFRIVWFDLLVVQGTQKEASPNWILWKGFSLECLIGFPPCFESANYGVRWIYRGIVYSAIPLILLRYFIRFYFSVYLHQCCFHHLCSVVFESCFWMMIFFLKSNKLRIFCIVSVVFHSVTYPHIQVDLIMVAVRFQ